VYFSFTVDEQTCGLLAFARQSSNIIVDVFAGLPDQGFEDSDNSSIFSSPSPTSRRRMPAQSAQHQQFSFQSRDRDTPDSVSNVAQLRQQSSMEQNSSPTVETGRPLSFVLSFQADDSLTGCLNVVEGNQRQVSRSVSYMTLHCERG
jgi:hypothetical protein